MEQGFSSTEIASGAKIAKDRPKLKIKTFESFCLSDHRITRSRQFRRFRRSLPDPRSSA
jgi:hypothetical protein